MRAIFISYRREDAEGQAGRLFDDLVTQFGEDSVYPTITVGHNLNPPSTGACINENR